MVSPNKCGHLEPYIVALSKKKKKKKKHDLQIQFTKIRMYLDETCLIIVSLTVNLTA